jgi:hypothetical protein
MHCIELPLVISVCITSFFAIIVCTTTGVTLITEYDKWKFISLFGILEGILVLGITNSGGFMQILRVLTSGLQISGLVLLYPSFS